MSGRFTDRNVLVTGASTGLGFGAAEQFAAEGATVYITARSAERLAQAAARIGSAAVPVTADVTV